MAPACGPERLQRQDVTRAHQPIQSCYKKITKQHHGRRPGSVEWGMSYKVTYYMLAIMKDGSIGNVSQGGGVVYTDTQIQDIPTLLNTHLGKRRKPSIGVIQEILDVGGECLIDATNLNKES